MNEQPEDRSPEPPKVDPPETNDSEPDPLWWQLGQRLLPYLPVILAVGYLAWVTTKAILEKNQGEPGVPLDDSYIHFQYAKALAQGRFFAFVPGEGYTSGATSLLWPVLLAPFYAIGFRDTAIIWPAWFFGWFFLGLLAIETKKLAEKLVGDFAAISAGAAVICFGGYTWFAASAMEVTPLGWILALTARLCSQWSEDTERRNQLSLKWLLACAVAGPLIRPEGSLASGMVLLTIALFAPKTDLTPWAWRSRVWALLAMVGPMIPPFINKVLTGHFATSTTLVKWLPVNPYYSTGNLWPAIMANVTLFRETLLDGKDWSYIFIPSGAKQWATAALIAIPFTSVRSRNYWRALLVFGLAIGMALPATYHSFLWNRLRYLWPFAFAWCIGIACFSRLLADLAAMIRPRYGVAAGILTAIAGGFLADHLSMCIDDVAGAASAIHRQQVKLGRWAKENLPVDARIGVNDTGAIAYFSDRKTFDVVGLTTPDEAEYWVAGTGARFEHYERLSRENPNRLPTHFIVYPHWMGLESILGRELTRATVVDSTILGGQSMVAYEADYSLLHSGDFPMKPPAAKLIDEIDIADLVSEREHLYEFLNGYTNEMDCVAVTGEQEGIERIDGARLRRQSDRFKAKLPAGSAATLVGRFAAPQGVSLNVKVDSVSVGVIHVLPSNWIEIDIVLPANSGGVHTLELASADARMFSSMHYWVYE